MSIHDIKSVEELEKITGIKVAQNQRSKFQEILDKYPVRLTDFLINLVKKSPAVALQFLPNIQELENIGYEKPWVGVMDTGIHGLERMYIDRCIIMPINQCPSYCRFCFRKFYEKRSEKAMSYDDIDKALTYIKKDKRLKGVLITGGDPLLDLKRLEYIMKNLRKIDHIQDIRIGTRSVMYDPERITDDFVNLLLKYHDLENMKPVEIATHFNHPDELTPESKKAILKLTKASIRVYNQTVLLKNVNDDPVILMNLFRKLRLLGVELYYLFHCIPVKGIQYLRTSIQKGLEIKKYFRGGFATGRINPTYVIATKIGKVEIGVDGFIEKRTGQYVWIKTPYKIETYKSVFKDFEPPKDICKVDSDGFISIKYLDGQD
jgi:lysine 2,3-aminomutase